MYYSGGQPYVWLLTLTPIAAGKLKPDILSNVHTSKARAFLMYIRHD